MIRHGGDSANSTNSTNSIYKEYEEYIQRVRRVYTKRMKSTHGTMSTYEEYEECVIISINRRMEPPGKTCSGRFFRLPLNRSFTENEKVEK
jgi:hypothetical protein